MRAAAATGAARWRHVLFRPDHRRLSEAGQGDGATLSLQEFAALYAHVPRKKRPKTPKDMDDAFRAGASPAELAVWAENDR